jgi:hypothetical protein
MGAAGWHGRLHLDGDTESYDPSLGWLWRKVERLLMISWCEVAHHCVRQPAFREDTSPLLKEFLLRRSIHGCCSPAGFCCRTMFFCSGAKFLPGW